MVPPARRLTTGSHQSNERGVLRRPPFDVAGLDSAVMARPVQFEHYRYLGDKRTQIVYDLDLYGTDPDVTAAVDRVLEVGEVPRDLAADAGRGPEPRVPPAPLHRGRLGEFRELAPGAHPPGAFQHSSGSDSRRPLCLASNATSERTCFAGQ